MAPMRRKPHPLCAQDQECLTESASVKIAPMATIHQYSPENYRKASRRMSEWKRLLDDSFFSSSIPNTINKTMITAGRTTNHKTC
jgi:hypothetical protein